MHPLTAFPLPCRVPAHGWHLHRRHLGERQLGTLLGMGPEGSVGAHHDACLCHPYAQHIIGMDEKTITLPLVHGRGIPRRTHHLFWREFLPRRVAQLCELKW